MKTRNILPVILIAVSCTQNQVQTLPVQQTVQEEVHHKLGGNTINVERVAGKGVIRSANTVPVYSLMDGVITKMNLIEGQQVKKGEILAEIDDSEAKLKLLELESELQKKAYDVQTTLIGMGYRREAMSEVPADVRESVEVMMGYSLTKVQIDNLKKSLDNHIIRAPFSGSILNVNVNRMYYARKGESLFHLMDTDDLIIRFEVLETLLSSFSVGQRLEFTTLAFGDKKYDATLLSIAPNVESTGMVVMTARINGSHPELRPGMTTFVNY